MQDLDAFITNMKQLGALDEEIATAAAPVLEKAAKANVAAGLDPNGAPWPAKKDGERALKNAAAAVRAEADGTTVALIVEGPEFFHQTAKEGGTLPRRALIPDGPPTPDYLTKPLGEVAALTFSRVMGAR